MAGISSKVFTPGFVNKKNRFQNQELSDDLGANFYEFKWRSHDPQIGRFIQIDPLSEKYAHNSTYAFSENKVTSHIELEGLEGIPFKIALWIAQKKAQYGNSNDAAYRLATGTSDRPSTPGPSAIQNAQSSINQISDQIKQAERALDVLNTTASIASLLQQVRLEQLQDSLGAF